MMSHRWLWLRACSLIVLTGLAGCTSHSREAGDRFLPATERHSAILAFAPGSAALTAADINSLRHLRPAPHPGDRIRLVTEGEEAYARAAMVSQVIGVPVQPYAATWPGHTGEHVGMLEFVRRVALGRACRRRGIIMPDQLWQFAPDTGRVLAPPGCATAQDLAAMVADQNDLFEGNTPAPAAAQPFVDAAQRYDRRTRFKPPYGQNGTPFYNQPDAFGQSSNSSFTDSGLSAGGAGLSANAAGSAPVQGSGSAGVASPAS